MDINDLYASNLLNQGNYSDIIDPNLPPDVQVAMQQAKQRQRIAGLLIAKALQPIQGQMVGDIYVPPSPLQGLAQLGYAYGASGANEASDKISNAIAEQRAKKGAQGIQQFNQELTGTPAIAGHPLPQDSQGNVTITNPTPAVPGNPDLAMSHALVNQYISDREMKGAELQYKIAKEEAAKHELLSPEQIQNEGKLAEAKRAPLENKWIDLGDREIEIDGQGNPTGRTMPRGRVPVEPQPIMMQDASGNLVRVNPNSVPITSDVSNLHKPGTQSSGALDLSAPGIAEKVPGLKEQFNLEMLTGRKPSFGMGQSQDRAIYNQVAGDTLLDIGGAQKAADMKTAFQALAATNKEFATGTAAKNVVSINTTLMHMGTLNDLTEGLKNGDVNSVNAGLNYLKSQTGDPSITNFQTAAQAVANETMRVFRQVGAGSEKEIEAWGKLLSTAKSPEQLQGAVKTLGSLLYGRLYSLGEQYKLGTKNPNADTSTFVFDKSKDVLNKLGLTQTFNAQPQVTSGVTTNNSTTQLTLPPDIQDILQKHQ